MVLETVRNSAHSIAATLRKKGQDFSVVVLITDDANVSDCLFGKSILFASEKTLKKISRNFS